jgi:periplasmic copper chaperone A
VADLTVKAAWIRWLPAELPAGGYLTLANRGDRPLVLIGASSAAYGEIGLHRSVREGGMSKMAQVASITIPAHSTLDFAASGYHLMLMQQRGAVSPGQHVPITLHFAGGQAQMVDFEVRQPNGSTPNQNMNGMSGMPGMPH